jgi:dUTP pyrophosphatase
LIKKHLPLWHGGKQICPVTKKSRLVKSMDDDWMEELMNKLRIAKLVPGAIVPTRKHPTDAGIDLYASAEMTIAPLSYGIVPTGITIELPPGTVGLLKPKGRSNYILGAGVVDVGYQGEILIKIFNPLEKELQIQGGEAIGQLLVIPVLTQIVCEVSLSEIHKDNSARGNSGGIVSQYEK